MFVDKIRWVRFYESKVALMKRIQPGRLAHFKVGSKNIVIARTKDALYAHRDKCPHQGKSFAGGWCTEEGHLVCPVHRYAFHLQTGRGHGTATETYPLETRQDGLYIGFPYVAFRPFGIRTKKR